MPRKPKEVDRDAFTAAWKDKSLKRKEISEMFSIPLSTMVDVANRFKLPPRHDHRGANNRTIDPTPEQIKERCLEIQAGWSEERFTSARMARVDYSKLRRKETTNGNH